MTLRAVSSLCVALTLCVGIFAFADVAAPATQPSAAPSSAVDLRNTICPVSGDKVADSNLVEVYDGKVYHLCCPDCHKDFEKDPAKFASAVAADPAKYGVK